MKTRFLGGSMAALLLALALAGCNKGGSSPTTPGASADASASSGSPSDALVTVDGTPITRGQLAQLLETKYGPQELPSLINSQLLAGALKGKGGTVSDDEVNAELTRLEDETPTLKAQIAKAPAGRVELLKNQLRDQLTIQKLLIADVKADDAKVKAFFSKFSSYYAKPAQVKVGYLAASTKVRADVLAKQLKANPASFDKLVKEQQTAQDPYGARSTSDVGQYQPVDTQSTPALQKAKTGDILPVQAITPQGPFLIVKVVDRKDAVKPDFNALKDQVTTDYKLAQVAQEEIKKNPSNPPTLEEIIKRVAVGLSQPNPQTGSPGTKPTLRQVLITILQPRARNMVNDLSTSGKVQISDPAYKDLAQQYAPVPTPGAPTGSAPAPGAPAPGAPTGNAAPKPGAPASGAPGAAAPAKP